MNPATMKVLLCFFIFLAMACSPQEEKEKNISSTELWYLQWEMVEHVIEERFIEANSSFDNLLKQEYNFNKRAFCQGLIAKINLDRLNEVQLLLESSEKKYKNYFCEKFYGDYEEWCGNIAAEEVKMPHLRDSILIMYVIDQYSRGNILESIISKYDIDTFEIFNNMSSDPDLDNELQLKSKVNTHGVLTCEKIGPEAMEGIFYIIQHSRDVAWQMEMLEYLQQPISNGCLEKSAHAYLYDRIRVRKGEKQLYGTQIRSVDIKNGFVDFFPIEDSLNIDFRREKFDLEPLKFQESLILREGLN